MSRLLLLAATIMGLNAANVPGNVGDALKGVGNVGSNVAGVASNAIGGGLGGLNIGNISQASVLGGFTGGANKIYVTGKSFGGGGPVNIAKPRVAKRNNGFSF